MTLVFTDTYEIDAYVEKLLLSDNFGSETIQRFLITFVCPLPFWKGANIGDYILLGDDLILDSDYALGDVVTILSYETSGITFPLNVPAAGLEFTTLNSVKSIDNFGDVPAPLRAYFYGPCDTPKVTNSTTGYYVEVNKTLTLGQILIIDSTQNALAVTLNDNGVETSAYSYITAASRVDKFQLATGVNSITYTTGDNNPLAEVHILAQSLYIGA